MNSLILLMLVSAGLGLAPSLYEPLELTDVHGNPYPKKEPVSAAERRDVGAPSRCPDGMVAITGGSFSAKPVRAFCLDIYEVTVGDYAAYVEALKPAPAAPAKRSKREIQALKRALAAGSPGIEPRTDSGGAAVTTHCTWPARGHLSMHPINCISVVEAQDYCRAHNKRLPTRIEWQWAARGGSARRKYPWGDAAPSPTRVHMAAAPGDLSTRPQRVAGFGPSGSGLYDLGGNVSEWTACLESDTDCAASGGNFRDHDEASFRVAFERRGATRATRSDTIGFRCAAPMRGEGDGA